MTGGEKVHVWIQRGEPGVRTPAPWKITSGYRFPKEYWYKSSPTHRETIDDKKNKNLRTCQLYLDPPPPTSPQTLMKCHLLSGFSLFAKVTVYWYPKWKGYRVVKYQIEGSRRLEKYLNIEGFILMVFLQVFWVYSSWCLGLDCSVRLWSHLLFNIHLNVCREMCSKRCSDISA